MHISDTARARLDIQWIADQLKVSGEAGNRAKRRLRTYGPEDGAALREKHRNLRILIGLVSGRRDLELTSALRDLVHLDVLTPPWGPVELAAIGTILKGLVRLEKILTSEGLSWDLGFSPQPALDILSPHIARGGFRVDDSGDPELRKARQGARELDRQLKTQMQEFRKSLAEKTGIPAYRFAQDIVIDSADTGQTDRLRQVEGLVEVDSSAAFIRFREHPPVPVRKLRSRRDLATRQVREIEAQRTSAIARSLAPAMTGIEAALEVAGEVDLTLAQARFAIKHGWCEPVIADHLEIRRGRHIRIQKIVEESGAHYVPLDVSIDRKTAVVLGSNMGGKTVMLRTLGHLQAMVQIGMFPPAKAMTTRLFDSIHWVGASQDSAEQGLSSYGLEIMRLKEALEAGEPKLLLLDEFARSTSYEEGLAMTRALIDVLERGNSLTVFAGHLHSLAALPHVTALRTGGIDLDRYHRLAKTHSPLEAIHMSMNYTVRPFDSDQASDAITIARLLGLSEELTDRATHHLTNP